MSEKYVYHDATGKPWLEEIRTHDEAGKRTTIYNIQAREPRVPDLRPLYDLHRLAGAELIVLVEGPHVAQRLAEHGYTATSNMFGSNSKGIEKTDWSAINRPDALVVMWRDNDPSGAKWQNEVAAHLDKVPPEQLRAVVIPEGKPEQWDAADALAQGGDELVAALIADAVPIAEHPDNAPKKGKREAEKFFPLPFAQILIAAKSNNIFTTGDLTFYWDADRGIWTRYDDGVMRRDIAALIGPAVQSSQIENVLKLTKAITARGDSPFATDRESEIVHVANGDLSWTLDGWELGAADPATYTQTRIPHAYIDPTQPPEPEVSFARVARFYREETETAIGAELEANPAANPGAVRRKWLENEREQLETIRQMRERDAQESAQDAHERRYSRFLEFLDEVFRDDADRAEKIKLVQQAFGLSLLRSARHPLIMILIGQGANGKSVLLNILAALVGKANTTAVSPAEMEKSFRAASLDGKFVNLVPELRKGEVLADAALKQMSSGDAVMIENKFERPYQSRIFAKSWFSSNSRPILKDLSRGMTRRLRMLTFNREFAEHEQDRDLAKRITTSKREMQHILAWSLAGLAEVLESGELIDPPSSIAEIAEWLDDTDNVKRFLEERCELHPNFTTKKADLHAAYVDWANDNRIQATYSLPQFTGELRRLRIESSKSNGARTFKGVRIRLTGPAAPLDQYARNRAMLNDNTPQLRAA